MSEGCHVQENNICQTHWKLYLTFLGTVLSFVSKTFPCRHIKFLMGYLRASLYDVNGNIHKIWWPSYFLCFHVKFSFQRLTTLTVTTEIKEYLTKDWMLLEHMLRTQREGVGVSGDGRGSGALFDAEGWKQLHTLGDIFCVSSSNIIFPSCSSAGDGAGAGDSRGHRHISGHWY